MLSIDRLSFRYSSGADPVLRDLTLAVAADGIFGLLGPNGAGKTTLLSILAGQLRAGAGSILFDGEPLEAWRRRQPRAIGLVPQEYAFYPMLSCLENLRFFGGVQGLSGAQLKTSVERVVAFARIEGVLKRRAGLLSGGLKRRLNLAIGILTEPRLLLLDEPTVGVDPQSRAFLLESIRALAGPGKLIIYTSHYMEEVQAICDSVGIIDRGRLLVSGALAQVLADDAGVLDLHLSAPLPAALMAAWRTRFALSEDGAARYRLRLPAPSALSEVIGAARAAGCEPLAANYGRRDLEQLFMQLTRRSLRDR